MATNAISNYYKKITRITSHHLHFSMCSKCPAAQTQVVDVDTNFANSTFSEINCTTQTAHSLLMYHFSLST